MGDAPLLRSPAGHTTLEKSLLKDTEKGILPKQRDGLSDGDQRADGTDGLLNSNEHAATSNAPFYAQLHAIPAQGYQGSVQDPAHSFAAHNSSMQRLNMSGIASALSETAPLQQQQRYYQHHGFAHQSGPPAAIGLTSPSSQAFQAGHARLPPYIQTSFPPRGLQSPRVGQSQPGSPSHHYGRYHDFAVPMNVAPQMQAMAAMPAPYMISYTQPDLAYHASPAQQYGVSTMDPRTFVGGAMFSTDFMPSPHEVGE